MSAEHAGGERRYVLQSGACSAKLNSVLILEFRGAPPHDPASPARAFLMVFYSL